MPAKPELLGEVAVAYSKLGGGAQVAEMIEMEMDGAYDSLPVLFFSPELT